MTYDFTSIINRHGKDSIAVDLPDSFSPYKKGVQLKDGFDLIPMWVADMNFAAAPSIQEAMTERIKHPTFGYFEPRPEYYEKIMDWQKRRNGVTDLKPEYIGFENGVLGGVSSALRALCQPGESVLLHSPTYVGFTGVLNSCGYHAVHSPLKKDAGGIWRMDFADMEKKITENHIHTTIFCSPHNPCGRVWERWEIEQAMELFKKHRVTVISDEIWSDLILGGNKHIPTQTVSSDAADRTIAMYATTKTFSLAGLEGSYHIIRNPELRDKVCKAGENTHYNSLNLLSMYALLGAYTDEGEEWLNQLLPVLDSNVSYACDFIKSHWKGVSFSRPQGTYMLFIDCAEWCRAHNMSLPQLLNAGYEVGVVWQNGEAFFGPYCIRMNLALPLSRVKEAFDRLDQYVFGK